MISTILIGVATFLFFVTHALSDSLDLVQPESTFSFLNGQFSCTDVFTARDGTRQVTTSNWSGGFILAGQAIQDHYQNDRFSATNIRIYNPKTNLWRVHYFREPGGINGSWTGGQVGSNIELRHKFELNGKQVTSRLVFEDPRPDAFTWYSEYTSGDEVYVDWTSDCKRSKISSNLPR